MNRFRWNLPVHAEECAFSRHSAKRPQVSDMEDWDWLRQMFRFLWHTFDDLKKQTQANFLVMLFAILRRSYNSEIRENERRFQRESWLKSCWYIICSSTHLGNVSFQPSKKRRPRILVMGQVCFKSFNGQLLHNLTRLKRARGWPCFNWARLLFLTKVYFIFGQSVKDGMEDLCKFSTVCWDASLHYFRVVWTGNTQNAAFAILEARLK